MINMERTIEDDNIPMVSLVIGSSRRYIPLIKELIKGDNTKGKK